MGKPLHVAIKEIMILPVTGLVQAPVSVSNASTQIVDAPATGKRRRYLYLHNLGAETVYITVDGGAATTSDLPILPGDGRVVLPGAVPQGKIYGIRPTATENVLAIYYDA